MCVNLNPLQVPMYLETESDQHFRFKKACFVPILVVWRSACSKSIKDNAKAFGNFPGRRTEVSVQQRKTQFPNAAACPSFSEDKKLLRAPLKDNAKASWNFPGRRTEESVQQRKTQFPNGAASPSFSQNNFRRLPLKTMQRHPGISPEGERRCRCTRERPNSQTLLLPQVFPKKTLEGSP